MMEDFFGSSSFAPDTSYRSHQLTGPSGTFSDLTQKVKNPILPKKAKEITFDFIRWSLVVKDGENILRAVDLQIKYPFSFWDSLILQAAIDLKSEFLLSEDFQDGQAIESVTILNPFLE